MEWIVFDYGGVICFDPPEEAGVLLSEAIGAPPAEFWPAYWADRAAYDQGVLDAAGFWHKTGARLGRPIEADLLPVLAELDRRTWTHLNDDTIALLEELAGEGAALALLSNAPAELARHIESQPWAELFRHRFFSADLRLVKPDPEIYLRVCEGLGAAPEDLVFIDDRPENLDAARELGITPILYTDTPSLRAELGRARACPPSLDGRSPL